MSIEHLDQAAELTAFLSLQHQGLNKDRSYSKIKYHYMNQFTQFTTVIEGHSIHTAMEGQQHHFHALCQESCRTFALDSISPKLLGASIYGSIGLSIAASDSPSTPLKIRLLKGGQSIQFLRPYGPETTLTPHPYTLHQISSVQLPGLAVGCYTT